MTEVEIVENDGPDPLRGALVGLVAGLAASAAMAGFQAVAGRFAPASSDDPATVKAAETVKRAAGGAPLSDDEKPVAGNLVHFGVGALLGIAYGVAAEYRPEVTRGAGSMFGSAAALLLDEGAVPAAGLSDPPGQVPAGTHLYGAASHLVFGVVAEGVRRLLRSV